MTTTQAAYDAIAEWYDQSVRRGTLVSANDPVAAAVFDAVGNVKGQRVCDLACGQGEIARQLARRGAHVVGVDMSQKLLDIARREEATEPMGITYQHDDAQRLDSLPDGAFDGVLCHMALMDIPDLDATFQSVRRVLRPGGWFVFAITHPCFQRPPGGDYHREGFWRSTNPDGVRGRVGAHHRTLSTYLNALVHAGLFLERLAEPPLPGRDVHPVLVAQSRRKQE
jgi:ubiquinone/menaquinone biosynthesis C-methylase UbiE